MEPQITTQQRPRGIARAIALILFGMLLLLVKNGVIERQLVTQWWPMALVLAGGWLLTVRLRKNAALPSSTYVTVKERA